MTPEQAWDAHVARHLGTPYHEKLTPTAAETFRAGWEANEGGMGGAAGVIEKMRAALIATSLGGVADETGRPTSLQSWCDEGWTCDHEECVRGRAAIQTADEFTAILTPPPAGEGRVEEIRAHVETRRTLGVGRGGYAYDEAAREVEFLLAALATRDAALARIERGEQGIRGLAPGFYGHACQIAHEALGHGTEPYHRCPLALSSHAAPTSQGADWHCRCPVGTPIRDGWCQVCRKAIAGCD